MKIASAGFYNVPTLTLFVIVLRVNEHSLLVAPAGYAWEYSVNGQWSILKSTCRRGGSRLVFLEKELLLSSPCIVLWMQIAINRPIFAQSVA